MPPNELTDQQRFPLLSDAGRRILTRMTEHPAAPPFNTHIGDRLTAESLQRVRQFAARLAAEPNGWQPGEPPAWLPGFVSNCLAQVPAYRAYQAAPGDFYALPTFSRAELGHAPWAYVPDDLPLDDLILYTTSGVTGHPIRVPSHPEVAARHLPILQAALSWRGVALDGGADRVAVVMVCFQQSTVTCACPITYLSEAGFAKINLNPAEWRAPGNIPRYINALNPEVLSGDPLSFAELMRLPLTIRPDALISTSMALLPGMHQALEAHFGCPVIDLYSLNEAGPVAAGVPGRHQVLPHHIFVEILDEQGAPCPPGKRGEITLTGGFNFMLPLLRYRTGDYASLEFNGRQPVLIGLEGRLPVVFRGTQGQAVNNIEVTMALKPFALAQFTLHQAADGSLALQFLPAGPLDESYLRQALAEVFGMGCSLTITEFHPVPGEKVVQYSRE